MPQSPALVVTAALRQLWDPKLVNTTRPICVVDLRSFNDECMPKIQDRLSGRSMDWTNSSDMLKVLCDDAEVLDQPHRGVRGAPATHLSMRDLGAEGILLLGTTTNTILALGFRKALGDGRGAEWLLGLAPEHVVKGDSRNSDPGTLGSQKWWGKELVECYKGKYGARANHLPVAVYAYQSFSPDQAGYLHNGQVGASRNPQ